MRNNPTYRQGDRPRRFWKHGLAVGVLLLFACQWSLSQPPVPTFQVGKPEIFFSHEQQKSKDLAFIDTGLSLVKVKGQNLWLSTEHDHEHRMEGQIVSYGPLDNPYDSIVRRDLRIEGVPELRGYQDEAGNACWIGSAYFDSASEIILAFVHLEFWPPKGPRKKYMRFGLAISEDLGHSFEWCGYIISPDLPYEMWSNEWVRGDQYPGSINMGWPNLLMKDGFFYVYYRDSEELTNQVEGGMAVARASVKEVLEAAQERRVSRWHKYHDGAWNEPGLGGKFTVLLEDRGLMHGDAAYCKAIDHYVLVVRDGKHHEETGALLISFSSDGLNWTPWQDIYRNAHLHDYPSIIGLGSDNEVLDHEFYVYYKYDPDDLMPEKYGTMQWNRIKVTVQ
ncbi:MAG: hypothetical protein AAF804_06775 [Bacteroidota bacterium]